MNAALQKIHEDAGHHPESLKHKVGSIVTSYRFELLIMLFIFADVGLVAVEMGVDHHFFCIGGDKVAVGREELEEIAERGGESPTAAQFLSSAPASRSQGDHLVRAHAAVTQANHLVSFLGRWQKSTPGAADVDEALLAQGQIGAAGSAGVLAPHAISKLEEEENRDQGVKREGWGLAETTDVGNKVTLPSSQRMSMARGTPVSVDPNWGVNPTDVHPAEKYAPSKTGEIEDREDDANIRRGSGEKEVEEGHGEEHEEEAALVCEDKHGHHSHHLAHTCHLWSIIILCFFEVELMIKIWIGPEHFFKNPYHVFDLIVVSLSLLIDTVLFTVLTFFTKDVSQETLDIAAAALVITRIWRIVRICHGIFEVVHAQKEEMDELEAEVSEAKSENKKLEDKIQRLESRSG